MKRLFIGKLSYSTTAEELRSLFAEFGPVGAVNVVCNNYTGRSCGFAFVEIQDDHRAREAIASLHGTFLGATAIVVEESRPGTGESRGQGDYQDGAGDPRLKQQGKFK
jgi:RNA recognition motif-containing protein